MSLFTRVLRLRSIATRRAAQGRTTAADQDIGATRDDDGSHRDGRISRRRVAAWVVTALACLLVLFALLVPNQLSLFTPRAFVRIPMEALLGVAVLLLLPARTRGLLAVGAGLALGLLTIVKLLDVGFWAVLNRQFDLLADWGLLDDGVAFLTDSIGRFGALGAAGLVTVLAVGVLVLLALAVRRLSRVAVRHRSATTHGLGALTAAWLVCAVLGAQLVPGAPVASSSEARFVYDRALLVREGLRDQRSFAAQAAADVFRDTPGDQLLTALRGKDVIVSFVESYGRSAIENPQLRSQVDPVLDAGTRQLTAAGFGSRSAFLTSPTFGGYSWLAHSTLQSGVWIDKQQRYRSLVATDRLTLTGAFRRAGWQTVGVEPANTYAWPEGAFYGFDRVYDSRNLGYRGPAFSWSTMPDQYALAAFHRLEHGKPNRAPLMAEITLTSSHSPWAPLPRLVGWDEIGDGSIFGPIAEQGQSPETVWRDPARVRTEHARSVAYSLGSLISYVERYGNDNLVLVLLGDHQPPPIVSGQGASHDVPITLVARDPAVLQRISGWGWHDGLRPGPQAPVWRMDAFRDRFLTAFGPSAQPTRPGAPQ